MSRTLNLVDRLLARARHLQELGRLADALALLKQLAGFRGLPAATAEEAQARLADIQLRRRKYLAARRHLAVAIGYHPDNASYHYQMAGALDADYRGDPERAAEHYRQSLQLDPDQPRCLAEYGLLILRLGQIEEGLEALRRAVETSPADPVVASKLVEGLCEAERPEEARTALRTALFRNPRDLRFRKLWNDFRFQQLREQQEAGRWRQTAGARGRRGPVLLPFLRPVTGPLPARPGRRIIRHDAPGPLPPPHPPRPTRQSDHRHAQ
jgi:Tfp pilus assembly protein PilF